jgi:hypothetical protein
VQLDMVIVHLVQEMAGKGCTTAPLAALEDHARPSPVRPRARRSAWRSETTKA